MGVRAEAMIGCCLERSPELIVAFLATLKIGAAYVPLDPTLPAVRLNYLIDDSKPRAIITTKSLAATALAGRRDTPLLHVDDPSAGAPDGGSESVCHSGGPTHIACVMYTSGSTGLPKGVMIENRAVVRLVRNTNYCRFGPDEVFLQFAPFSFDASIFEIWGALLNGGRLVVMPPSASSLADLGRAISERRVTTLWLTAGLFNLMVEQQLEDLRPLRQLFAGGDVLSARHVRMVLERHPQCVLINGYGPTENTTFTCCHLMRSGDEVPASVPIGRPISNTLVHILDHDLKPVPTGEAGELFAGGDGVARGYLNSPELSREKFLPDPFSKVPGARMYRTGDLARRRPDGVIEFLGRIDNQVKIAGYRIEPGEIEAALESHSAVAQTCVVARADEGRTKRLVAYYVPVTGVAISASELRAFLVQRLPQYMIPAQFVELSELPLSSNGKVDRSALPEPQESVSTKPADGGASNRLEQMIAEEWRRVLGLEQIGLDDNFFDLGGDSLQLLAIHSRLQKSAGLEIPIIDLFEFTTIRELAKRLGGAGKAQSFSEVDARADKQRAAFARMRDHRAGGVP